MCKTIQLDAGPWLPQQIHLKLANPMQTPDASAGKPTQTACALGKFLSYQGPCSMHLHTVTIHGFWVPTQSLHAHHA